MIHCRECSGIIEDNGFCDICEECLTQIQIEREITLMKKVNFEEMILSELD